MLTATPYLLTPHQLQEPASTRYCLTTVPGLVIPHLLHRHARGHQGSFTLGSSSPAEHLAREQ